MQKNKIKIYLLVFLIVALGFFLRIYNIENVPSGIYPDEAVNGEDALQALSTGQFQWFYPANQGREGFFMNLVAICFYLFGTSILTLKLPAILFSTLSIWGIYLLTKEMFNHRMALIASFLVAFSFWSINFGRISFRANMLPAILAFSFYFLFRALRTKKWWDFAIGGAIFGFGMHSYIAWRVAPIILIIFLIFLILARKDFLKEYWKSILIFLGASLLIAAPMFYTFYVHPEYIGSRSDSISIFSPELNHGNVIGTFLRSFSLSLIKYNLVGDMNWRHNFPPYSILDPLTGTAFVFGFIFSLTMFVKALYRRIAKKIRTIELERYSLLLLWFFIMLAPEFLTAEGNPHALRSIGTLPVVFVFASLTFEYFLELSKKLSFFSCKTIFVLIITSLLFIGIFNTLKYHIVWAEKERVAYSFNKNITEIAKYISLLPINQETYVITSYNWLERVPVKIFHMKPTNHYLFPNELEKIKPLNPKDFIVFFTENNTEAINAVQTIFPDLQLQIVRNDPGSVFYILKTN